MTYLARFIVLTSLRSVWTRDKSVLRSKLLNNRIGWIDQILNGICKFRQSTLCLRADKQGLSFTFALSIHSLWICKNSTTFSVVQVMKTVLRISDPNSLAPPVCESYYALRWIFLYQSAASMDARNQLWALLKLARKQKTGLEVLCHPLALLFYQVCPSQNSHATMRSCKLKSQGELSRICQTAKSDRLL